MESLNQKKTKKLREGCFERDYIRVWVNRQNKKNKGEFFFA